MTINVYDFYTRCLMPLTPHPAVTRILELVTSGAETTDDFSKVVALDTEVQHWLRLTVQRLGFEKRITNVGQIITLLGQNRIRDLIIGRHIERAFLAESATILGELQAKLQKEKEKKPAAGKKAVSDDAAAPLGGEAVDEEIIPTMAEFSRYLEYANRAEEVAISIRNSYPGQAFAGGAIFDYLRHYLRASELSKELTDPRLQKTDEYVEAIFVDGIRCGIAANEIMQKISIPHQKIVFMTAMLHNIGKILLLAYDPKNFEKAFIMSTGNKDTRFKIDSIEAEQTLFEFDHAQAGALFMGRIPFLVEIERSIDFSHNADLLRFSNPKLYAMSCVLRISTSLVKLYQRTREKDPNIDRIPDTNLKKSQEFQFLKLSEMDWHEIKANYALRLMKVQL